MARQEFEVLQLPIVKTDNRGRIPIAKYNKFGVRVFQVEVSDAGVITLTPIEIIMKIVGGESA